ncbi:protein shisa-5 [Hemicordylus capensis]|uniref:protein shisa-5 n=1 Tax=Hemicordylus capensis TaxID=884348 RepID=UPI00230438B2|nr:protein shisa-5 [Hemicordylus capensis]
MMAFVPSGPVALCAFLLLLLQSGGFCENCKAYKDSNNNLYSEKKCPDFCCGICTYRYCCSETSLQLDEDDQLKCNLQPSERTDLPVMGEAMKLRDYDWEYSPPSFGTFLGIGIALFVLFMVIVILCFTCSCCCLYKACRSPRRPVVTNTTTTTVVQVPYPQQSGPPPGYPTGAYQGYNPLPVQPQPGMPVAPYPTQYPPPYPTQPVGPPAYHETMAGAGIPVTQPPYNPAYMDPPKPSH